MQMADLLQNKVCVIDNGTGYTKMGWAGNTEPQFDIPTVVADHVDKQKVQLSKLTYDQLDFYIGNEAQNYSQSHNIIYPMKSGVIENWDLMEKFWHRSIFDYMRAEPDETIFILTEPPMNPPENRENTAEIYFETFNAKGLHISVQAVLSLFSSSMSPVSEAQRKAGLTGIVLDSGDGVTHVIPVAEGYVIGSCIKHIPLAGRDITQFIQDILKQRNEKIPAEDIKRAAREIKEKFGYCVSNGDLIQEFAKYDPQVKNDKLDRSQKFKSYHGSHPITNEKYKIDVGYERFLGPEMFFHPEFIDGKWRSPIDEVIDKAIQGSPIDYRRKLYSNVVLSGGSTLFDGFAQRLECQLQSRINQRLLKYQQRSGQKPKDIPVTVAQNPFQRYSVWQGGSLMAVQPKFEKIYHTRAQYLEIGPQIARYNAVFQPGKNNQYKAHVINVQYSDISPDIPEFFKHKRQVFVMTNAGRPIYVRYGNEIKSSIFLATLNAIMQKFLLFYFEDREKQNLFKISHTNVAFYFLQRNQICLMCSTTKLDDSEFIIYQMLDFLNVQLISIVTDQANLHLATKPNYDLGFSVGGSRSLLTLAIKNGLYSPCIAFNAISVLPMTQSLRAYIHSNLKDIKNQGIVCTILLTETVVIDIWRQKNMEFKTSDILIIQNMLQGQGQLKKGEQWIPVCLPGLSAMGFVYAYIHFFYNNIGIIMISDDSSLDMFQACKEYAADLVDKFKANHLFTTLQQCLQSTPVTPRCLESPSTIKHFIARLNSGQIFVPQYQIFGKFQNQFKNYMHKYSEIYKDFLISQQLGNHEGKQNYFIWNSDGFGMTQYHDVIILFCFEALIDLNQVAHNVHVLHKLFKQEELIHFFILKPS